MAYVALFALVFTVYIGHLIAHGAPLFVSWKLSVWVRHSALQLSTLRKTIVRLYGNMGSLFDYF